MLTSPAPAHATELETKVLHMCTEETIVQTSANLFARLYASAPTLPNKGAGLHWQSIQRKFHNICLLSHNGARCGTGSGAEDEAEAKLSVLLLEVLPREKQGLQEKEEGQEVGGKWGREEPGGG